ncbi:hypothetical protein BAE44_0012025 [Dichanthelium oligosanthes]|uniref:SANT domain-containing protein n=1 Tax=Dichanthelium oligosanthes TaxID=888268 RepID=A0A1E5VPE1_9POAL|nr:hypothetical protein BAE44_0012025 [Dichanthelium oligosanthes]
MYVGPTWLPQPQGTRVSSEGRRSLSSPGQLRGRDVGRDGGKGLLGPGDPSSQSAETACLPPKERAEFKSPELHSPHGNGADDNSSEPPAEKPLDPQEETPNPPPEVLSTKTGLGSHHVTTTAVSAPRPLKSSDVDVSMTQRNHQGDVLGLGGYIEKKMSLLPKTSLADVEEEVQINRKKTRLGWGQGLAKHEKQLKEQNAQKLVADGDNGEPGSSSTSKNKTLVCTATVPASPDGPSPPPGSNVDLGNNSKNMTEMLASHVGAPASSQGCTPPTGDIGYQGNSSASLTETVICPAEVPDLSGKHIPQPGNQISSMTKTVGGNCDPYNSSSGMTEMVISELASSHGDVIRHEMAATLNRQRGVFFFEEPQTYELQGSRFKARSQQEKDVFSEKITTFGMDFIIISSFLKNKTPTDCIDYYSKHYRSECSKKANTCLPTMKQSQEKCKNVNDAAPYMSGIATVTATKNYTRMKTVADDIKKPDQMCHQFTAHVQSPSLPDKGHHGESSMDENGHVTGNVLVGEMNAPSLLGMNSPIINSGQAVRLNIPKTVVAELKNLNEDSCCNEETRKGEQEIWSNKERCRFIQAIEKHGLDFASISVHVGTKSIQQCKKFLGKCKNDLNTAMYVNSNTNSTIDHRDGKIYQAGGSSGQGTSERMSLPGSCRWKIPNGTIERNQISSGKEDYETCAASEESLDNDNRPEAFMDLTEPRQNTDSAEIREHESGIRARADDVTHVQKIHQSGTTLPETTHQPTNQPDCIIFFGQVIYQDPSSGTNLSSSQGNQTVGNSRGIPLPSNTVVPVRARGGHIYPSGPSIWRTPSSGTNLSSSQGNQIVAHSRGMPSNTVIPVRARGGQVHPSGPSIWRSAPFNPGQQALLSNTMMPYGSTNGAAVGPPLRPGSSALVNMIQQRQHVHMTSYSMIRGGEPYYLRPGSSSSGGLVNFNDFNPGQQQWSSSILDTSRMVIAYPACLPGSNRNQAPTPPTAMIRPSRINREGASTSNTR